MSGSTFGVIGLGTMGRNLALNIESHGLPRGGLEPRDRSGSTSSSASIPAAKFTGATTLEALVAALERPRRIMMMIPAGEPVDADDREAARRCSSRATS